MDPAAETSPKEVSAVDTSPKEVPAADQLRVTESIETPVAVKDVEAGNPVQAHAYPAGFSHADIKARASMVSSIGDQPAEASECWGSDTVTKVMWILFALGFVTGITWVVNVFLPVFRKRPRFPTIGSSIAWWASLVMIVVYVILITTLAVVLQRDGNNTCECFNGFGGYCLCKP